MQSSNKSHINYINDDIDVEPPSINIVSVKKSENVTITLKTVVNMFNKLPVIKANKETYSPLRRCIWKKQFLNEKTDDEKTKLKNQVKKLNKECLTQEKKVKKTDDDEKIKLESQVKKLQEECLTQEKKLEEDNEELVKLKQQINSLENECSIWKNKVKKAEFQINEHMNKSIHLEEIIKKQQKIISETVDQTLNCCLQDIGILYWPINKYSMIKATRIDGHSTVFSKEFLLGEYGYIFLLEANLNGDWKSSWDTHLSVRLHQVIGVNDDNLRWPCKFTGIIGILDASGKNQNYFKSFSCNIYEPGNKQIVFFPEFIHQTDLEKNFYIANDTLTLFVMICDMNYFMFPEKYVQRSILKTEVL